MAFEAWIHQRMNASIVGWLDKPQDVEIIVIEDVLPGLTGERASE
jgi:hypothetical protein